MAVIKKLIIDNFVIVYTELKIFFDRLKQKEKNNEKDYR